MNTAKALEVNEEVKQTTNEEQAIAKWKAQWGKIYQTVVDGEKFIWRKLKRKEYVTLMSDKAIEGQEDSKMYERQDDITKTVMLFPENIGELLESNAGLGTTIADEILLRSGFDLSGTVEL